MGYVVICTWAYKQRTVRYYDTWREAFDAYKRLERNPEAHPQLREVIY